MLHWLDRVAILSDADAVPHDLVKVDEHARTEQVVYFVLARIMTRAQSAYRIHFVRRVMIDVHLRAFFPSLMHPIDETLEGGLFLITIMCPPVMKFEIAALRIY